MLWISRASRLLDFGSGAIRPLTSIWTTAGVTFLRIGASDGMLFLDGATGNASASAARPAVVATTPNAIAANTSIITRRNGGSVIG